jgi:hypothetical protein
MVLLFPDLDTFRLALTSGAVPPALSLRPVAAGLDEQGQVWVEPSEPVARAVQAHLHQLGVQLKKTSGAAMCTVFCCWPQVVPLERSAGPQPVGPQTPVLFGLHDAAQLATLVAEMLRLGNDRQGFRWLEQDGRTCGLLRVVGPPYYSLLRALDRIGGDAAPRAFREQAPRVWVELGYRHPLGEQIKPPPGQLLLLGPPREWAFHADAPFRDIYEVLEFDLPAAEVRWHDADLERKLTVPLRLAGGGHGEPAELWVLRERALETLDKFVQDAGDDLVARLAFAVSRAEDGPWAVLRVRPSKLPPPVLVLPAVGFRPYLKLPNLFLPCGRRLHPPLRRDAVRRLLAEDPDRVTWLYPHEDGRFTPENVPEQAFRPLADWVDYVLDRDHAALDAWVQAARFDFEPFVCKDDAEAQTPTPKAREPRQALKGKADPPRAPSGTAVPFKAVDKSRRKKPAGDTELPDLPRAKPGELQERLHALEKQFLEVSGPLDAPERRALWPAMGRLNQALGVPTDAAVCWVNALWEDVEAAPARALAWARAEYPKLGRDIPAAELDRLLAHTHPGPAELRRLAAFVVLAGHQDAPAALVERLGRIQRFLETHEHLLPVRAVWLAWASLARLAHGDVLGLARARDRLLERLFAHGLRPDVDLPAFLRFSGMRGSDRFRTYRDWLLRLPETVHAWIGCISQKDLDAPASDTEAYADLLLAYGLARLGEAGEARKLRARAVETLGDRDDVHTTLLEAFSSRIGQALDGKPGAGTLPAEILEYLEHMDRLPRYKVDYLRKNSRILEPYQRIDPYRLWTARYSDELARAVAFLGDLTDRGKLVEEVGRLLTPAGKKKVSPEGQVLVLRKALELAPRIGEAFALGLLARVGPALAALDARRGADEPADKDDVQKAGLLEKALFAAAHFNHEEHVGPLVAEFEKLLARHRGTGRLEALSAAAGECFRGLRKLGLRDRVERLLTVMADVILAGADVKALPDRPGLAAVLTSLLHVAAGWFSFGVETRARPVLDRTRVALFHGDMNRAERSALACAYVTALGQAPAEFALPRIEELFHRTLEVRDNFSTNSHYAASQLLLIEAVVLAVGTEDFAAGAVARHWLEDDEYLVRRRIHRDVGAAVAHA